MNNEALIREIINQVLKETGNNAGAASHKTSENRGYTDSTGVRVIPDLSAITPIEELNVPHPYDEELLVKMRASTPARIGVFRAGPRYKTKTLLKFKADHAVAMDAVFNEVPAEFLEQYSLKTVHTKCADKNEYLTRPDLGRQFDEEASKAIKNIVPSAPQVLVYVSDGLSSTAVEENVPDILPAIMTGLKASGITPATPFFVKFGRVPSMDMIGEITGAEVVCILVGERPGLVTAGSMSAYMAYKPTVGMPEARRSVISNIHKSGMPPAEAGAHIADVLTKMLKEKVSGLDLKL